MKLITAILFFLTFSTLANDNVNMFSLLKKRDPINDFWSWFAKNQEKFYNLSNENQEKLFDELSLQLNKIGNDVTFEFSPILENKTRELVISADGIKSSFPIVQEIIKKAPSLPNWKFIAFRQRHSELLTVQFGSAKISKNDIYFKFAKDNVKIAIQLHIRNYIDNNDFGSAKFIFLDQVLGEYDVEMKLSVIECVKLSDNDIANLMAISELPKVVDTYCK